MKLKITVHGVAYEVEVEVLDPGEGFPAAAPLPQVQSHPGGGRSAAPAPDLPQKTGSAPAPTSGGEQGSVASPISGTVVEIKTKAGDTVEKGQILLIIEAMKMNTSIAAPVSGKIKAIPVAAGDSVREGQILVEFE